jgi:NADH-quinone oxidoreductase subunit E
MTKCSCGCSTEKPKTDLKKLEPLLAKYKDIPGSLITVLQQTQDIYGYLPKDAIYAISDALEIEVAKIMGVITFYAQFRLTPIGKHLIMLCQGTACHVNGSEKICTAVEDELQIKDGETTEDNMFTIENVACLGCCSMAPVMMIRTGKDSEVFGPLTPKSARQVIKDIYKAEKGAQK